MDNSEYVYWIGAELRRRLWMIECILRRTHRRKRIRNITKQSSLRLAKCTPQLRTLTLHKQLYVHISYLKQMSIRKKINQAFNQWASQSINRYY